MHRYTAQLHLNNQGIQHKIVAVMEVENLRQEDTGTYKCRADFKKSPTKHHRFRLSVLSKFRKYNFMIFLIFYQTQRLFLHI